MNIFRQLLPNFSKYNARIEQFRFDPEILLKD